MEELSKLEYVSTLLMQTLLSNADSEGKSAETIASDAVYYAKALIKEVEKNEPSRKANELLKRATGQK